jgi:hypothetical protein
MIDLRTGRRGFLRTALGAAVLPMASTIPALFAPAVARAAEAVARRGSEKASGCDRKCLPDSLG